MENELKISVNIGAVIFLECMNWNCVHYYKDDGEVPRCNLKNITLDVQGKCIRFMPRQGLLNNA